MKTLGTSRHTNGNLPVRAFTLICSGEFKWREITEHIERYFSTPSQKLRESLIDPFTTNAIVPISGWTYPAHFQEQKSTISKFASLLGSTKLSSVHIKLMIPDGTYQNRFKMYQSPLLATGRQSGNFLETTRSPLKLYKPLDKLTTFYKNNVQKPD